MLDKLLENKKATITDLWLDALLQTYPPDTVKFLQRDQNRFTNPVGHILTEGIAGLFEGLVRSDENAMRQHLENMLKVRSVQSLSPSRAVSFIFLLKDIVRRALADDLKGRPIMAELVRFDARIDQAALIAFDVFVQCREQLYQLRVNEVKRNVSQILRMSGYFDPDPAPNPDLEPGSS